MSLLMRLRSAARNLFHRRRVESDLDDEVRGAFELLMEEKIRAGASTGDARRAATIELGQIESVKDQVATFAPAHRSTPSSRTSVTRSACFVASPVGR